MILSTDVLQRAEQWILHDPNPTCVNYVRDLVKMASPVSNEASANELNRLFPDKRISFGTAGLRARMQPGPLGMNDLVVVQTAQGLARYVQKQHSSDGENRRICAVVGYDHRQSPTFNVSSMSFAIITALVFLEAGIDCLLMDGFVPTPMVPYGVLRYVPKQDPSAVVFGIMVTASHNPALDAGYKVYWTNGCQIRSPTDSGIAESILENLTPWKDYGTVVEERRAQFPNDPCLGLSRPEETTKLIDAYMTAVRVSGLVTGQADKLAAASSEVKPPRFCYSAMHGVGYKYVSSMLQDVFGLPASSFLSIPAQQEPDATFRTVSFPNPEEKGALDLAKHFAVTNDCNVILANDPDADRLAVVEYDTTTKLWTDFTGDQIGVLLGHWLWSKLSEGKATGADSVLPVSMCCSTVSSQMLAVIAKKEGFHIEDTLTGFKWIGSRAGELSKSGYKHLFCYEEAIGYCCGSLIFDKDGLTAAGVMMELALSVYVEKRQTLAQHLQSLYNTYGEFVSNNGYFILENPSVVPLIMDRITNHGKFDRTVVQGQGKLYEIASIRYLGEPGFDSTTPDKKPRLPTSKSAPMVTVRFTNGGVAQFRASGTEPKFKFYLELPGQPGVTRATVEEECRVWSVVVLQELINPSEFGLKIP